MQNNNTGLTIPYTIRDTPDKGRGVFADTQILKGTTVWRHVSGQYTVYNEENLKQRLTKSTQSEAVYELTHIFGLREFPGYLIRIFDDGVLINHSDDPNLVMNSNSGDFQCPDINSSQDVIDALLDERFSVIALRDVAVGEELTMNYNSDVEDPEYFDTLCEKYGVSWEWQQ